MVSHSSEVTELPKGLVKVQDWLKDAENAKPETAWRDNNQEDYQFYSGLQDSLEVTTTLEEQSRPTTTYNVVKPKIDMLIGLAAQNRYTHNVLPVSKEDEPLAELMAGVIIHFRRKLKLSRKELDCFEHTVKSGRSLLYYYIDKQNPFKPTIKLKRFPGDQYIVDPEAIEFDMSDARFLFLDRWVYEEEAKTFYPSFNGATVKAYQENLQGKLSFFNEANNKYRLVECWYRDWEKVRWFINPVTQQQEWLRPKDFRAFEKALNEGVEIRGEMVQVEGELPYTTSFKQIIKYMIFTADSILEQGDSPYWFDSFPAVQYGAYKDDDNNCWFGAIKMMKDPQRALNTMRRQLSHLLQTLPKGIFAHEIEAVLNIEEYEERSADPGFHLELSKGGLNGVKFMTQPPISPVYQTFDAVIDQSMKDASGIQDPVMGTHTTSREPGVTLSKKQESNLAVLHILFNNYAESRLNGTKILMGLIQQYISDEYLIRVEGSEGAQMIEINSQMNPQLRGWNDTSAGEFDLELDETLDTVTMRSMIAAHLADFARNNPGVIPPDIILEYLDVPYSAKQRVISFFEEQRAAEQLAADREYEIEIMKIEASLKNKQESKPTKRGE